LHIHSSDSEYDIHIIYGQEGTLLNRSTIDFVKISSVLTDAIEAVKDEQNSAIAVSQLENAQNELQKAMSFSLSFIHK